MNSIRPMQEGSTFPQPTVVHLLLEKIFPTMCPSEVQVMRGKFATTIVTFAFGLVLVIPGAAFAQNDSTGQPMQGSKDAPPNSDLSAGNLVMNPSQNGAKTVKDSTITAWVKDMLYTDQETQAANIKVSTTEGLVTLTGQVPSLETAQRAEELARQTVGVRGVNNDLAVAGQRTMGP